MQHAGYWSARAGTAHKKSFNYSTDLVFAAAATAQRINGSYIKVLSADRPEVKETNRQIVERVLASPESIDHQDKDRGQEIRRYFKSLCFNLIQGKPLSDFQKTALQIAEKDGITAVYDLAVICSLPQTYQKAVFRDAITQRVEFATGGFIGSIGDKIELNDVEVVKCNFSPTYGKYYLTCITGRDEVVWFASSSLSEIGAKISIAGTVKAHRGGTQLNRVKKTGVQA